MLYNFQKGEAGKYISHLINRAICANGDFKMALIKGVSHNEIEFIEDHYYLNQGQDRYLMFAYLRRYNIQEHGNPRFHICKCETRNTYSGYDFANSMPVDIYDKSIGITEENLTLPLCKNCRDELLHMVIGAFEGGLSWEKIILKKANKDELWDDRERFDGYSVYWRQISHAKRQIENYTCEECKLQIIDREDQHFMEVHHKDYNKMNNHEENLACLCVQCHANIDDHHKKNYSQGTNFLKLEKFKMLYHNTQSNFRIVEIEEYE